MCFYGRNKYSIAEEDITCYKFLKKGNNSPYDYNGYFFAYKRGKANPIVKIKRDRDSMIHAGYHSYIDIQTAIRKGNLYEYRSAEPVVVKKFKIPKGTRYCKNKTEYVSETIIML